MLGAIGLVSLLQPERRRWLLGAVLLLGTGIGAAAVWLAAPAPPPVAVAAPAVVAVPVPIPPTPCLAAPAEEPPEPDGIAVAPRDPHRLATWSRKAIYLSTDGGGSVGQVLGDASDLVGAAFDEVGDLYVLTGAGQLGRHTRRGLRGETWVDAFPVGDDTHRVSARRDSLALLVSGDSVAVIGIDPKKPLTLLIRHPDSAGRWRSSARFQDSQYQSWDGVEIDSIQPAGAGRVRVIAQFWQGGECGYGMYHALLIDVRRGTILRVRSLGESPDGLPSPTYGTDD
jgi:hypothetical protein